jgi:hypothetical protein
MLEMGAARQTEGTAPPPAAQPAPQVVDARSRGLDIPQNKIFMGSLAHTQSFSIQDLGGPDYLVTGTSPAHL